MNGIEKHNDRLLLVFHPDGWLEVYSSHAVPVKLLVAPMAGSAEAELLSEEYIDGELPRIWRRLYEPDRRIFADLLRPCPTAAILCRDFDSSLSAALDRVRESLKAEQEVPEWIL